MSWCQPPPYSLPKGCIHLEPAALCQGVLSRVWGHFGLGQAALPGFTISRGQGRHQFPPGHRWYPLREVPSPYLHGQPGWGAGMSMGQLRKPGMVSAGWTKPRKVMANTAGGMLPTHRNKPRHSPMAPGSAQVCRGGSVPGAAWGNSTHHRSTCDLLLLTPGQFAWPETKFTGQTPCAVPSGKSIPSVAGSTSV